MARLFETADYIIINVVLLFLIINFNLEIGTIYGIMAMIDWFSYYISYDSKLFKMIPLDSGVSNKYMSLVWAAGAYVLFIFAVNYFTSAFSGVISSNAAVPVVSATKTVAVTGFTGMLEKINSIILLTFSATPILYGSTYIKLAVWGILIPVLETRFFFRTLMNWGVEAANIPVPTNIMSWDAVKIALFFGALFSVFHIVAKGITNNMALLVTFAFGFISIMLVLYFRQATEAIFLHIITNTIATMQQLGINLIDASGINYTGVLTLAAVVFVAWFILFQRILFLDLFKGNKGISF